MRAPTTLRRDLLVFFGLLFGGALLLAGAGLWVLLPIFTTPAQASLFMATVLVVDLLVLFVFGGVFIRRTLVGPMERLSDDVRRMAEGDVDHRLAPFDTHELEQIRASVNAMADRLLADRELLAENVRSLDQTNRELVEARDQVLHSSRLASVGTLAAGIAHEVGNPLGAVMAYLDVARNRAAQAGGDTEILDATKEEARRIDRIVRGLLDYARPRGEGAAPFGTGEVIHRVRDLLDNQGALDGVDHTWQVPDRVPPVLMEPHRLEQVLVNLVLNALHALEGRADARIDVRLSVSDGLVAGMPQRRAEDPPGVNYLHRRRVSSDDSDRGVDALLNAPRMVVLEVSDNGPGVPEEHREAVFDPFFTTKEPGKGTGLGLSICARLIEGMGGRIEVTESEWGGASFVIRLPGVSEESV